MRAADLWFQRIVPAVLAGFAARAVWASVATEAGARHLLGGRGDGPRPDGDRDAPWLVVLLPMLREQAVAPETIAAFTSLPYVPGHTAVAVITTQREEDQRADDRRRLPSIAQSSPLRPAALRGLFPAARCAEVAEMAGKVPRGRRLPLLTALFDAQPTTAEVVAELTSRQNRERPIPLAHVHQPATGGRKAGQLNHALDRLGEVLAPLGWNEARDGDDTYVLVYDADAVPDASTLWSVAAAAAEHRRETGGLPAVVQQQRLPIAARRPFPAGAAGLVLAGEWVYQLRRSLGIELARLLLHRRLYRSRMPEALRLWLRPMVYAVGCGMAVHLPRLRELGGFPEPMEDIGVGHRLSLLGAGFSAAATTVLDEPYTDPEGLANLHALAFTASARPDRHAAAVADLPSALPGISRAALVAREWAEEAAWLLGAPLTAAAVASARRAGRPWPVVAAAAVVLHGPVMTIRLLALAPRLRQGFTPPAGTGTPPLPRSPSGPALAALSPLQPFVRLWGPGRSVIRRLAGRDRPFGKTER